MRVLVTGADGLLGSNLVRLLLEKEYKVRVFLFPSSNSQTLTDLDIERYYGDILKPESIDDAIAGCDAIIHGAAMTNTWPSRSAMVRRVNIDGTKNAIEAAIRHNVDRFIYIGSGSSVNSNPTTSKKEAFPGARFGLDYIDSKYEALMLVQDAVTKRGLKAISVLPTFMIGPFDSGPSSGKMVMAVAQGKMKFYTKGGRNFVHVNDVASAVVNSLKIGTIGKYYVACGENLSYKDFLTVVADIVRKPKPFLPIPNLIVKALGYTGGVVGKLFGKEPMLTYPMACISCEDQFVTCPSTEHELHMPRTPINVAIKDCYDWFLENNYLRKP